MSEICFLIPGQPKGKARPRVTRNGTYTPKATREFEALIRSCYAKNCGSFSFPPGVPLCATIHAYFAIPKSYSKKQREALVFQPHPKKPDADNIAKAVLDSLNGHAFSDDGAIARLTVHKFYTDQAPHISVHITDDWAPEL